jgi:glutaredoxin
MADMGKFIERMKPMRRITFVAIIALTAGLLSCAATVSPVSAMGCSKSVTMYNAWWCPYCRQVRAILARNHIKYTVLDATTPQVQAIMLRRFGDTGVPRTVIGGVVVEGVDEERIKQLCRIKNDSSPSQSRHLLISIPSKDIVD